MSARMYIAEALLPGQVDRLCDTLADVLVQEALNRDPHARCDVMVSLFRSVVFVSGSLRGRDSDSIDVAGLVRGVCASTGYGPEWGLDPAQLKVQMELHRAARVEQDGIRADEQTLAVGYALDLPGTNYLPPEQWLAQRLQRRLTQLRIEEPELRLGPQGGLMVLLQEDNGRPTQLGGLSVSLRQAADGSSATLFRAVRGVLAEELAALSRAVPGFDARVPDGLAVNGTAPGPDERCGGSGRCATADRYGPRVSGGSSASGKDFYHPHRAGTIIARRLARAVVATGGPRECTATLAFVPGRTEALVVSLCGDGQLLDPSRWAGLLDYSLEGIGQRYTGRVPLPEATQQGIFSDPEWPWEKLHFDHG
jgi:S-adenosylmethionine synthetase